jgi:hypothetical protein
MRTVSRPITALAIQDRKTDRASDNKTFRICPAAPSSRIRRHRVLCLLVIASVAADGRGAPKCGGCNAI